MTIDDDVNAARTLLGRLIAATGWTRQDIDAALGFARGYMSRLLTGNTVLTYRHVLLILDTIGVERDFFFATLHRKSRPAPEALRPRRIEESRALHELPDPAPPPVPPATEDDYDRRIRDAVRRVLAERGPDDDPPANRR